MYDAREETKKKLQALAMLEDPEQGGLPGLDYSADTPNGPMRVTRKPLRPLDTDSLPVAAPVSGLGRPSAPAQFHDKPSGTRDAELEAAQQLDADEKSQRLFETATRQLIGGITRTPVQPTLTQPSNSTAALTAKRHQAKLDALRELEVGNTGKRFDFEQADSARKAAETKARDERDFNYRKTHDAETLAQSKESSAATRGLTAASLGIRREEADVKKTERADKEAAGEMDFLGGKLTLKQGLSDTERGQARAAAGAWNAADNAVANFQQTLEDFAKNPSTETKGRVTAALRTASSAFNSAIGGGAMSADEARAMSEAMGADILSPSGLQALAQSVLGDDGKAAATISNRVRAARQANKAAALGKLQTYGSYTEGGAPKTTASARPTATGPNGEKVEWNGSEWVPLK